MRTGRGTIGGGSPTTCARCGNGQRGPASLRGGQLRSDAGERHYRNASREAFAAVRYAKGKISSNDDGGAQGRGVYECVGVGVVFFDGLDEIE